MVGHCHNKRKKKENEKKCICIDEAACFPAFSYRHGFLLDIRSIHFKVNFTHLIITSETELNVDLCTETI